MNHGFNRMPHEHRRVVHHRVVHAVGEVFLQLLHRAANARGEFERIGAGSLEDRQRDSRLVIQQRAQCVAVGAKFYAGDVSEQCLFAVGTGLHDDLAELLRGNQPALCIDLQLEIHRRTYRLLPNRAGGDLNVLFANRADNVARSEISCGEFVGVKPDAHRVIARTEHFHVAGAGDARQHVFDLQRGVVAEINLVVATVRREQVHHQRQVGRLLCGRDAEPANFLRQFRQRLRNAVLHLHLGFVDVRAELESYGQRHHTVTRGLRKHVERILDTVDGLLQRRRDRFGDGLRVRAGIRRAHDDGGRNNLRVFADRQPPQCDEPNDEDHDGKHARKDRTPDEEIGEIHRLIPRSLVMVSTPGEFWGFRAGNLFLRRYRHSGTEPLETIDDDFFAAL